MAAMTGTEPAPRLAVLHAAVRRGLDRIYDWAAYLAAASMGIIFLITLVQISSRYLGFNIRGLSDYAGYFMASSVFLAFAHTLNRGAHIRIEMFMSMFDSFRRFAEIVSIGASVLVAMWFAYHACGMVYWSFKFGDVSTGLDATPLWIPQLSMAFGSVLFAIALADQWLQLVFRGSHSISPSSGHQ